MWPFASKPTKDRIQGVKSVKVEGWLFKIRKVNPLVDFSPDKMPQIFASQYRRPSLRKDEKVHVNEARRAYDDMSAVIEAGLVDPKLVPVGKGEKKGLEGGITVDDIFRDPSAAAGLYWEIIAHSLGLKPRQSRFFLFLRSLRYSLTQSLSGTEQRRTESPTEKVPISA